MNRRCTNCGGRGHNRVTCPSPPVEAAHSEPVPIRPMLTHRRPLRDCLVHVELPRDLSEHEARQIGGWVLSLAAPVQQAGDASADSPKDEA